MKFKSIAVAMAFCATATATAGEDVVKASQFGWNGEDDTVALQKALDSGAKKVVVDRQKGDWVTRPLFVRKSNVEIVFEDGVTLRAKKGEYRSIVDSLVTIDNGTVGVTLRGEGNARLVMNKADYIDPEKYTYSQWRHTVFLRGCRDATVKDLTLLSSGGDGVYVNNAKNARLENLVCDDHNRQGISIIAVDGLVVRNCRFSNTYGAYPMAGLDFEPNNDANYCENVLFEKCAFVSNATSGVIFCLPNFTARSRPVTITMRDCEMSWNKLYGISYIGSENDKHGAVSGRIVIEGCRMEGNGSRPFLLRNQVGTIEMVVKDCVIDGRNVSKPALRLDNGSHSKNLANVKFDNVKILVDKAKPYEFAGMAGIGLVGIDGALDVERADGTRTRITAEKMMADHKPRPELLKFKSREPNYKKLKPVVPFAKLAKPVMTPAFRFGQTFVQYVPGPGEYPIKFTFGGAPKSGLVATIRARSLGADVGEFTMDKKAREFEYVIKHKSAGPNLYIFEVAVDWGKVSVTSPWPGCGTLAQKGVKILGGKDLEFYFFVPDGAKSVLARVSPADGEPASAKIVAPDGTVMAEKEYTDSGMVLRTAEGAAVAAGAWKVVFPKVFDDCAFRLGGDAVSIVSFSPETLLVEGDGAK